jgi:D-sedoheptulose 7-phosphate isomerase
MLDLATASLKRSLAIVQNFADLGLTQVVKAAETIAQSLAKGGKLLIFGNGGSAADAQHMAGEMVNRFLLERPGLPAIALTTDTSVLTAIGNDYSFYEIFVKQVKALGRKGDVALGISTSGRSPNVVKALAAARGKGITNLGLTGCEGGDMGPLCDVLICAPSDEIPRIQEVHALAVHILCELVEIQLFGRTR